MARWTILVLGCGAAGVARAGAEKVSVSLGVAAMAGTATAEGPSGSYGAAGGGFVGFRVAPPIEVWVGAREGLVSGGTRVLGAVDLGARLYAGESAFLYGGLAHHHETPWASFQGDPVGATFGVSEGITHRSGFEVGAGWSWALPAVTTTGVATSLAAHAVILPDAGGPVVYGLIEQRFTVQLGRPKEVEG